VAIGKGVYQLPKDGVIKWEDAVKRYQVRTLKEIVALKNLSVEQLERGGVRGYIARAARQGRQEAIEQLEKAGVAHEGLVKQLVRGLRIKATITRGAAPVATPLGGGFAAELARRLAEPGPAPIRVRLGEMRAIVVEQKGLVRVLRPGESGVGADVHGVV
jgi:hypothetical protein